VESPVFISGVEGCVTVAVGELGSTVAAVWLGATAKTMIGRENKAVSFINNVDGNREYETRL
jgi:hypothetical protein